MGLISDIFKFLFPLLAGILMVVAFVYLVKICVNRDKNTASEVRKIRDESKVAREQVIAQTLASSGTG